MPINPTHTRAFALVSPREPVPVEKDLFVFFPQVKPEANAGFVGLNRNPGSNFCVFIHSDLESEYRGMIPT